MYKVFAAPLGIAQVYLRVGRSTLGTRIRTNGDDDTSEFIEVDSASEVVSLTVWCVLLNH